MIRPMRRALVLVTTVVAIGVLVSSAPGAVHITRRPGRVAPGRRVSVAVLVSPGARCSIGVNATLHGRDGELGQKRGSEISWAWTVPSTARAGTWPVTIDCGRSGRTRTSVQVTKQAVTAPTSALPLYGPVRAVGRSREFGSVYVTDAIASADFNGDGLADVVYMTANSGSTSTFAMQFAVSEAPGRFVDGAGRLFVGPVPRTQGGGRLVLADFNNDGRPDVFYADSGAEAAPNPPGFHDTLVLSTSDGKLADATANIPQQADFTHSAAAGDVDGDGSIDLFIGNLGGNAGYSGNCCSIQIWLNDGTGHFRITPGLLPDEIADGNRNSFTASAFADVNGDGRPDLLLGGSHGCTNGLAPRNDSQVLINDGGRFHVLAGAFPPKAFGRTTETLDIKPTDLN